MPRFDDLTPSQRQAVECVAGPLLILAGPGSGKTRVVTRRIAHLVESGAPPWSILAITFTNKAAKEMAGRVTDLLPGRRVWVSTFHRFCASLLRRHAASVGLQQNYSIYDTSEQTQLVRGILSDLDIDAVHFPPSRILGRISRAKNDLIRAEDFVRDQEQRVGNHMEAVTARVWPAYQQALLAANAVDFDDLLLHAVTLLEENPELRAEYDDRFRYVLVDEYQDTNAAQYRLVRALSVDHPNLCATGDPDQSIYGWRGARIENILRFERDYPQTRVVRLEANFRSTGLILHAADRLIVHNTQRKHKELTTDNPPGRPVELLTFADGRQEADEIAGEIRRACEAGDRIWSDFAIFYRVNALSRELELALARHRVPYQVAAGVSFYERAEIKDALAYLRLVHNPADRVAFLRIVNNPIRGVGKTTQSRLIEFADRNRLTLLDAARQAELVPRLPKKAIAALKSFARTMTDFSLASSGSVEALLRHVLQTTRYAEQWTDSTSEQDAQRLANVEELITAAGQYDATAENGPSLEEFLESASLVSDIDGLDAAAGTVTLMTLHAAKGLEFPVVYVVAVEQNLLPHERSIRSGEPREIEEERRLLFVGMTRAMQELSLTCTKKREFRGRPLATIFSQFLTEIPLLERDLSAEANAPADEWFFELADRESPDDDAHPPAHADDDEPTISTNERPSPLATETVDATDEDVAPPDDAETDAPTSRLAREPRATRKPPRVDPAEIAARLTTGADLLNGTGAAATLPVGFGVGMTVRHPRYGLGAVVAVSGFAKRRTVTVDFEDGPRRETFVVAHSPLQPVGLR